jgi:hypothetical protein
VSDAGVNSTYGVGRRNVCVIYKHGMVVLSAPRETIQLSHDASSRACKEHTHNLTISRLRPYQ